MLNKVWNTKSINPKMFIKDLKVCQKSKRSHKHLCKESDKFHKRYVCMCICNVYKVVRLFKKRRNGS